MKLTQEQRAVVRHRGAPLRVVAGPGTGKTSCLAARIQDLILADGVEPKRILAITFTRAAAGETRLKLEKHGIKPDQLPDVRTLHSKAVGLLRRHSARLGISAAIRPLGGVEEVVAIKDVAADMAAMGIKMSFKGNETILHYHRAYKSEQTGAGVPAWISGNAKKMATHRQFSKLYEDVQAFYSVIDWFRVVSLVVHLLNTHPDVLADEQARTDHLLIDEYQDLNPSDQRLAGLLIADRSGLCVVGDEDQSIYESQRYAAPSGLVNFDKTVPGTVTLPLTVCHRSPQPILDKAGALIRHNTMRIAGKAALRAADPSRKGVVATIFHKSKKAEIEWLVNKVTEFHKAGFEWRDILVLFAEGQIATEYIEALKKNHIPVDVKLKVAGPFDSLCFSKVLATLRFIADQSDNMAVRLCLDYWPRIGAETIKQLRKICVDGAQSLWNAVEAVARNPDDYPSMVRRRSVGEFHSAMTKLLGVRLFDKLIPEVLKLLPDCVGDPGTTILNRFLADLSGKEAAMSIREVLGNFENEREAGRFDVVEELPDKVRVMTMHSAKGLEAKLVFIPALEDDLMPGFVANLEERRRLFYVSVTRAKQMLIMSWASQRTGREIHRTGGRMLGKIKSRFLREMGE